VPLLLENLRYPDDPDLLIHSLNVLGAIEDGSAATPIRKLLHNEPHDANVRFAALMTRPSSISPCLSGDRAHPDLCRHFDKLLRQHGYSAIASRLRLGARSPPPVTVEQLKRPTLCVSRLRQRRRAVARVPVQPQPNKGYNYMGVL
jgi:hypothetical protein